MHKIQTVDNKTAGTKKRSSIILQPLKGFLYDSKNVYYNRYKVARKILHKAIKTPKNWNFPKYMNFNKMKNILGLKSDR